LKVSVRQVEIKELRCVEERALLDFFASNLNTWERFHTLWEWRKIGVPKWSAAIAEVNSTIVGCVGVVPASVTVKGCRVKASWQQDSLVAPSMRRRGLGKRLVGEGARGWDLVLAKGTSEPMYALRKSLGFRDVPNSNYLIRECKRGAASKTYSLWRSLIPLPQNASHVPVEPVEAFDQSFDSLAKQLSKEDIVRLHKGQGYLNWRYFECPGGGYRVFRAGEQQARGAIVLSIPGSRRDEGWIVDLICRKDDKNCAYGLLRTAMNYFDMQSVSRVFAFATLPAAREWLYRVGFIPTRHSPRFTYRLTEQSTFRTLIAEHSWDFWHGDGDVELYS
jgi:GNAT superfamily N-acetyltransferase